MPIDGHVGIIQFPPKGLALGSKESIVFECYRLMLIKTMRRLVDTANTVVWKLCRERCSAHTGAAKRVENDRFVTRAYPSNGIACSLLRMCGRWFLPLRLSMRADYLQQVGVDF